MFSIFFPWAQVYNIQGLLTSQRLSTQYSICMAIGLGSLLCLKERRAKIQIVLKNARILLSHNLMTRPAVLVSAKII